jgi:uncharacterized protein YjiS (DUF1127 family)
MNDVDNGPSFEDVIGAREHFVRDGIPSEIHTFYRTRARLLRAQAIRVFFLRCRKVLWPLRRRRRKIARDQGQERDRWQRAHALPERDDRLLQDIGFTRAEAERQCRRPFWKGL